MTARPPLDGVRVLDLSRVLAGPLCTMVLADLGADVVKVEHPAGGDETRGWGPPFEGGEASYFLALNRGKRSAALDLTDPGDRDVVLGLAASCDVVVENFKAGGLERLGLGLDALRARRPDVVLCSVTGFGSAREPAGRPGYDFLAQAESGLMSITGHDEPAKVGVAIVDVVAGLHLATAVLAALRRRDRDGVGAHVEVSLLDAGLASLVNVAANALAGAEPRRWGNAHPNIVPYQTFATADGDLALAVGNDGTFARLCAALGVAVDERFTTNAGRVEHREELVAELGRAFAADTADGWVARLGQAGVPAGKVRTVGEALDAAAAAGDPAVAPLAHPTAGTIRTVRPPARFDGEALMAERPPPLLGEHTEQVRQEVNSPPSTGSTTPVT